MNRLITWDADAMAFFRKAINFIAVKSPKNAEKVEREILSVIN